MQIILSFISLFLLTAFTFEKPIPLIVPFGVGGPTDVLARHTEHALESHSKLQIAVINQGGASGNIGMRNFLQKDRALLLMTEGIITNKNHIPNSYPLDITNQVTPVYIFGNSPYIVFANARFNSFNDLVAESYHKEILVGSAAPGSGSFESYDLLCNKFKILKNCRVVIYSSASAAIPDMLGGRLDMYSSLYPAYNSFTGLGTVKALTILSSKRFKPLPEIPSTYELGFTVENYNWYGLFHKGLSSQEVLTIKTILNDYFTESKLLSLGYEPLKVSPEIFWKRQLQ